MADTERFIAYAFSVGDVLISLAPDLTIRGIDGACGWLGADEPDQLRGTSILDFLAEEDRPLFRSSVRVLSQAVRLGPIRVHCGAHPGSRRAVGMYLSTLSAKSDGIYVVLVSEARMGLPGAGEDAGGLMDLDHFLGRVKDVAAEQGRDGPALLITLVQVDEASITGNKAAFGRQLAALSVDGKSAARLGKGRYALVHEALDGEAGTKLLTEVLAEQTGEKFTAAALPVDEIELSDADAARAVVYSIRKFADESEDFDLDSLSKNYRKRMAETRKAISEFRDVLRQRRFALAYQPIVDLDNRAVHHVEALARFDMRRKTTAEMIGFAEDAGLIVEFDLAVLAKVARALDKESGLHRASIAINVSGRSLSSPSFIEALEGFVALGRRFEKRLLFEITESAQISDLIATNAVVQRIRAAGHPVCLDDFGAGLASYKYLRHLEVDYVKIDGSYVQQALTDPKVRAFLHSMATLCSDLGIETIGECVESEAEAALLSDIGVRFAQGYLFGSPQSTLDKALTSKGQTQQPRRAAR